MKCACGSETFPIDTYKRVWHLCEQCGSATQTTKARYPLEFLPLDTLKHHGVDDATMWDYMAHESNVPLALADAQRVKERLDVRGKRILDISGGSGQCLKEVLSLGATGVHTEFNEKSVASARSLGLESYRFDFQTKRISEVLPGRFDIVMARAAIMFCKDLDTFVADIKKILNPGGMVFVEHSVVPTLGMMIRTQSDDHSYFVVRQPQTVIDCFKGFDVTWRQDETDQSLYVYDHDFRRSWLVLHYWYEIKGARKLLNHRKFAFPARDRRRSSFVFRLHH